MHETKRQIEPKLVHRAPARKSICVTLEPSLLAAQFAHLSASNQSRANSLRLYGKRQRTGHYSGSDNSSLMKSCP
ncbi:unnamed protein product [Ceratitis capitata]|uniref:(Mediterranean fruit fly) hypothetical protein n=1 Tax=Ceratitis capitata TaxID=7213 RepID=A0A811U9Q1_CERCA|nr:unnamed protein product [Ceratitis capitata]